MNSNAHIVNLSAYEQPEIVESNRNEWVLYGTDNEYFDYLIDNYLNSSTNNAIIKGKGRSSWL